MARRWVLGAVVLWMVVAGAAAAQIGSPWLWNPYLGALGNDFVAVSWKTSRALSIDVRYSLASIYDAAGYWEETLTFDRQEGQGEIWLRGLVPGSMYRYQVVAYEGDAVYASAVGSFSLPEKDLRSFSFLSYGETRSLADRHKLVADAMAGNEPHSAFTVHVGGLVETSSEAQYTNVFWAIGGLASSCPYLPVVDAVYSATDPYYEAFALPVGGGVAGEEWWSFDYGPIHVIGLDSTRVGPGNRTAMDDQVAWLRNDLSGQTGRFVFVFSSTPLYGACAPASSQTLREAWEPLFVEYGVDAVVTGGEGCYEHVYRNGIHYLVTGGGGAALPSVTPPAAPGTVFRRTNVLHYLCITVADRALRVEAIPVAWIIDGQIHAAPSRQVMDSFVLEEE